ncbi:hypothetical protein EIP86_005494 [Pleurotus ostreatoroseus]|nr:hypothetical protein EIP86_005494 [Pleurotus ostreatoroseus]
MLSMLKRLQTAVHIVTDSGDTVDDCFSWEDEHVLTLNVNDLFAYVPSVPGISWERVADACVKTVTPVYQAVQNTIRHDLEDLAQFMVEIEDRHAEDDEEASVCETAAEESLPPLTETASSRDHLPCSYPVLRPLGSKRSRYFDPQCPIVQSSTKRSLLYSRNLRRLSSGGVSKTGIGFLSSSMSLRAILYAYVLGGLTFIPLVILGVCFYAIYTSVPVGEVDPAKDREEKKVEGQSQGSDDEGTPTDVQAVTSNPLPDVNDLPKTRKGWLTVRRTFEPTATDGSYVTLVRGFLDARSKDPKRSRPKDMWYVVLKGKVLYLYEDESMTECEAAIELGSHDVVIYPEDLLDGELFTKRSAICLKPKLPPSDDAMSSVTKEMVSTPDFEGQMVEKDAKPKQQQKEKEKAQELEKRHEQAREEAFDPSTPWFIFVRSTVEMEDWYFSLIHASDNPPHSPMLNPLQKVFQPVDMLHLVETLDEQPDVIPMRWLNALLGRIFFSFYRTKALESYIIGRLMKKLSKVKRPSFLTDVVVREVSVGNRAPTFSKPMLKELTKEGDAALEVHLQYKGEFRITIEATATINLGSRFKSYVVKLVLAAVLRELEGNLLVKVKRPPSNRIWYAFTQMPRMVLDVEPIVSDRQITWSMILSTIESRLKEVILESVVLPNMDDIAFFESIPYKHRGGIWDDASREERRADILKDDAALTDEDLPNTPASAPVSDASTPLATDLENDGLYRTQSAPGEPAPKDAAEMGGVPIPRASTTPGSATSSSSSARRRTWFNGAPSEDAEGSSSRIDAAAPADEVERGRTVSAEGSMSRRASSTPSHGSQSIASDNTTPRPLDGNASDGAASQLEPIPIKRSSSQHSRASSSQETSSIASSLDNTSNGGPSESLFSSFLSKSPAQPSEKALPTSPTTTFFQTLKSRDKQAISNSAKEAMRKWGVNWGGLKKTEQAPKPEEGSGSDTEQRREADSKARPHYADVRAAVEQRKGPHATAGVSPALEASEAIAVPGSSSGKERASSFSSSNGHAGFVEHDSSPSTSPRPGASGPDTHRSPSPRASPSALPVPLTRVRTTSHGADSVTSTSSIQPTLPPDEDIHPASPIHTQPAPPKTMTIPGIHASHRGEVMSLGYAPPPPPAEPRKPAMQSVYRLWKNPGAAPPQTQVQPVQAQEASSSASSSLGASSGGSGGASLGAEASPPGAGPETQVGFTGRDQDATNATSSTTASTPSASPSPSARPAEPPMSASASASPALPPRPAPPPLPPRSHSTNALQLSPESPKHAPATAALQSIVSRDRSRRASVSLDAPPVLPPRRAGMGLGAEDGPSSASSSPALSSAGDPTTRPKPPLPPRRTQPAA